MLLVGAAMAGIGTAYFILGKKKKASLFLFLAVMTFVGHFLGLLIKN